MNIVCRLIELNHMQYDTLNINTINIKENIYASPYHNRTITIEFYIHGNFDEEHNDIYKLKNHISSFKNLSIRCNNVIIEINDFTIDHISIDNEYHFEYSLYDTFINPGIVTLKLIIGASRYKDEYYNIY